MNNDFLAAKAAAKEAKAAVKTAATPEEKAAAKAAYEVALAAALDAGYEAALAAHRDKEQHRSRVATLIAYKMSWKE